MTMLALASCVTADPRLVAALKETSVREIRIETAPDIRAGFFSAKADPQLPSLVSILHETMVHELVGLPGGSTPARLVVTLHNVDVASREGRVITGSDSYIQGTVRLENAKTGQLIAEAQRIRGQDHGVKGQGLGIAVALVINAAEASQGEDVLVQKLSASFTRNVKAWLKQK